MLDRAIPAADLMTAPEPTPGPTPKRFGVRSIGMALKARRLERFLGGRYRFEFLPPLVPAPARLDGLAGWGLKGSAQREARRRRLPYLALEDGFLSTAGLGGRKDPALSLTADMSGVHYDASQPCELERLIQEDGEPSASERDEALRLMELMRRSNLGKFNGSPDAAEDDPVFLSGPLVIVVDQIWGDKSIAGGGCSPETFERMLDAAIAENPGCTVVARVHPQEGRRGRKGHLRPLAQARGAPVYDRDVSWMSLARRARRVYVATSQAGLEALVAGTPVTCFGLPIYAGWGLTDDRMGCVRRTARRSLEAVMAAVYVRYPRYLSPLDGEPCTALDVARLLAARRGRDARTAGVNHMLGVHRWKDFHVEPFVRGRRSRITYTMDPDVALERQRREGGRIISWASREPAGFDDRCAAQGAPLMRMEDGFLRSVGLGANLEPPSSLVLDARGVYYDPSRPSDLEHLLETTSFDPELLAEARALREAVVAARISKYNVGSAETGQVFAAAGARARVLVPGQVENDASVLRGGASIRGNLALLEAVRAARPDAFIVYKPHPDVEAGLRPGGIDRQEALRLADAVADRSSIAHLLDDAQEVHTLTSLAGFEALLRGLKVATYGMPFYAGWGLTEDREACARRTRRLILDELVAGTLLLYPHYVHRPSLWPCSASDVVRQLSFSLLGADPVGLLTKDRARVLLDQWLGTNRGRQRGT
jgi:capsular polysaccharide export protein